MEALDDSIGAVVEALDSQNMLQKSVIIFIADNGGITAWPFSQLQNSASNWPLRGVSSLVLFHRISLNLTDLNHKELYPFEHEP